MRTLVITQKNNKLYTSERFASINNSVVDVLLCKCKIKY